MKNFNKGFKRLVAIITSIMLCIGLFPSTSMADEIENDGQSAYTSISAGDFLKADGRNLRKAYGTGDIVNLRGTNAGGLFVQEFWMTPTADSTNVSDQDDIMRVLTERFGEEQMFELVDAYEAAYWTEDDFRNIADLGMNCIRLPFWWRNLVDANGNWYGYDPEAADPYATAFRKLDSFVETAGEYGLYVILDFHGVPGSQNGSDHSGIDGKDDKKGASEFFFGDNATANQERYYNMLDVIAARYAGNPIVAGYDIMNEPFCTYVEAQYYEMLWNIYDRAYDVIRAKDADHVIIMEAVWNADALPAPALYGWENVMYEYHQYNYSDYDNEAGTQVSSMQGKLDNIRNADYNVPSYVGEFSLFNQPSAWDSALKIMTECGVNWTTWTYKTIEGYGMWGLYHHPVDMNTGINIETASFDDIKNWWMRAATSEGVENTALTAVVKNWAEADAYPSTLGAVSAEINTGSYYFKANNTQNLLSVSEDTLVTKAGGDVTDAERFVIETDGGDIYLKSALTGKYLALTEGNVLKAVASNTAEAERFLIKDYSLSAVTIKAKSAGLYVQEKAAGTAATADGTKTMGAQTFQMYSSETDKLYNQDAIDAAKEAWLHIEAETTDIHGGAVEEQGFYSQGSGVGSLESGGISIADVATDWSNIKYVSFNVNVEKAGKYQLVFTYNGDDNKSILVKANDGEAETVSVPQRSGGAWDKMWTKLVEVDLNAGANTICLSGAVGGGWINFDCFDLVKVPLVEQESGAIRYEGENFYATGYETSGGSHYSGSRARGGFNQDITPEQFTSDWSNVRYTEYVVYAEKAGEYTLTFGYDGNNASDMRCIYKINDGENTELAINGAGWGSAQNKKFDVTLQEGLNAVKISGTVGDTSNWANNDYLDVIAKGAEKQSAISGFKRYEGETAVLTKAEGSSAGTEAQDFFSGGSAVGNLSNESVAIADVSEDWSNISYITFNVNAAYEGDYRIVIGYNGDDDKSILVKTNGVPQTVEVPNVSAGHEWNLMHQKVVTVPLIAGSNTISITGALGGGWMNIDYIDVSKYPIIINEDGTERYEAETFDVKSANNPAREHQDMYSGLANENGVGGMGATFPTYEPGQDIFDTPMNYTDYSVFAETAGYYDIKVMGNGAGVDLVCVYSVNGEATRTFTLPNKDKPWDNMVSANIHVYLNAGYNDVLMAGTYSGAWLNYDYIDVIYSEDQTGGTSGGGEEEEPVNTNLPYETADGYMRYEAEAGDIHGGQTEYQYIYSGSGAVNGVGAMAGTDNNYNVGDNIENYDLKYIKLNVNAATAGEYEIVIAANGADKEMPIAYQINDQPSETVTIDNTVDGYSWDRILRVPITVTLAKGDNTVIIAGTYRAIDSAWLNYDYFDVKAIAPATSGGWTIESVPDCYYTGKKITPTVVIRDVATGEKLIPKKDYTVTYKNNTNAGVAEIVVMGKGNYSQEKKITFNILPLDITDAFATDLYYKKGSSKVTVKPVLTLNGKKLVFDKDYYIDTELEGSCTTYSEIGDYTVRLKGKGNYTGTYDLGVHLYSGNKTADGKSIVEIKKASIKGKTNPKYEGVKEYKQDLTVKYKNKLLEEGKDYTLRYYNNTQAGKAVVVITGMANPDRSDVVFTGCRELTFNIIGEKLLSRNIVINDSDIVYDGNAKTVSYTVKNKAGTVLTEGVDYTAVTFTNNVFRGKATLSVTGMGGYTNTVNTKFSILAHPLTAEDMIIECSNEKEFHRSGSKAPVTVKMGDTKLTENVDYKLIYKANKAVGEASVTIKGLDNFNGSVTRKFNVVAADIDETAVVVAKDVVNTDAITLNKCMVSPTVMDKLDGTVLRAGTNYEKACVYKVSYDNGETWIDLTADNLDASRFGADTVFSVTVTGKDGLSGSATGYYRLIEKAKDISTAKVVIKDKNYIGSPVTISKDDITSVTVKDGRVNTVIDPEYYEVIPGSYTKNINKGTATVMLRGTNGYGGVVKAKFKIVATGIDDSVSFSSRIMSLFKKMVD
ncbi:MAG: cellulase family glycosylhydrolase [Lachnospiraceae bacterium]|nr:cellulase family glycosylhydrolase [Lachnospiraceae bacterium]